DRQELPGKYVPKAPYLPTGSSGGILRQAHRIAPHSTNEPAETRDHRNQQNRAPPTMTSLWTVSINACLGGLVVAVGAWLASNTLSISGAILVLIAAAGFLWWRGRTITLIWAWSTLLLGIECFAWPIATMWQIRSA